jgi:hypothetical protein
VVAMIVIPFAESVKVTKSMSLMVIYLVRDLGIVEQWLKKISGMQS